MPKLEISKIHDAYATSGECPICTVMNQAEITYLNSFRGARVMAPHIRVGTNKVGFCPRHYEQLYQGEGKLGLSLMVHTHMGHSLPKLHQRLEALQAARMGRMKRWPLARLFRVGDDMIGLPALADYLRGMIRRCYICDLLAGDLERYTFTVVYLWQNDEEFLPKLRTSAGFCLAHFADLIDHVGHTLNSSQQTRWLQEVAPLMLENLQRLEQEARSIWNVER